MTKTRNKLKIMGLVLTMVLLIASLGVFSLTASAAEATIIAQGECGAEGSSVQWKYDDTGTLTISGSGAIADQFDNYDNRPWETYVDQITTIVVNDGITSIGEAAFWRFQKLTTAKLPDSLTTISQQAFYGCTALKTVNFPANLKTIEGWAFLGCALESVTLPEGLTTIGYRAFSECKNLTSVTVPASVTTIDEGAFGYSPAKITVAEDNLNYSSDEHGVLFDKDKTTLIYCRPNIEVETYTIPSTVTEICKEAFYGCKNLATITIPDGVQRIGSSAFGDCEALTTITIPAGVTTIEANTFYDCTALTAVTIPAGVATIDMWAFSGCTALTTVTIPTSVTSIAYNAFSNCSALTTVNVPCTWDGSLYTFDEGVTVNKVHNWTNGTCTVCGEPCDHKDSTHTAVTDKGDGTHGYACTVCGTAVTEAHTMDITTGKCDECGADMTVVATVTDGTNTYYAADAATLNQAVTAILETGSRTFTVELPADASAEMIIAIRRAICDTEGVADGSIHLTLKGVTTIPGTTNWDGVAFGPGDIYDEAGEIVDQELVTQLASINLPDVTEIGAQAFYFCENLVSVSAPKAQTIGAQAFGYTALTSVEFPELTTIPTDMFSGTWTLSSAKFPKVTTIEQGGLLVGAKFTPENNPTPFPLELTAEGNITFNGSNHFNIASQNYSGKVDLVLCCDKKDAVTFNEDGTATWQVREDLSYTFKSITFKHSYVNGKCTACGEDCTHTGGTATCTTLAVCDTCGVSYGAVDTTNHDSSVECENGFCPNGCYEPATLNAAGYYEIDNAGKLFWFAQQVNVEGNREIKGVLTADIELENRPWTPIGATGEDSNNFRGVFDGQNHTIKGLYVEGGRAGLGFFGEVRTGTVKNFTIYGEVVVNTEVDYVGGVIGSICGVNGETDLERNGAIIQNITSYVNLTAKVHGVGKIGGFVGYANHESLIENCSWYGTFDAGIYRVDDGAGGFIGHIYTNSSVTIRNCAAYGTIKTNYAGDYNNTATIYMGGFLSFSNTGAKTTLENCLFVGKFERGENLTDQAFLGAFGTLRSVKAIKNCYYLGDDGLAAVHSDSNLKPGSDNVEITSVTKAQLLSGEVAYKLGEHFGQILEGENRQSYPVLGGEAVPSSRFEIYGQQLNIGGDLSMKYYVMGYAPEFNSKGLYMEFSHNGVKTKVYAEEPNADGFYVFILEGINPQCMGDSIYAKLYYNETEVTSHGCEDGKEYSVEKNLLNLLEEYKDDAALVALINDTLAYGKAASEYKKHDTMTGDYTISDSTIPDATVTPNGAFTGYTVVFGQVNFIKVSVELADGYTLYLDGTDITSQLVDGIFKTDGIAPTNFDKKFTFEIKNGDTSVQTFAVSVNDYIGAQKNSATMGNLVKALYNYGYSAKVHNHVANGVGEHYFVDGVCACGELQTIDATEMTAEQLKTAVAEMLAAGEVNITIMMSADADADMFTALRTALAESTVPDGSINLTISGAKTVPEYGFFDYDDYSDNDDKNIAGDKLKSLTLPDVETIGDFAFSACTYLESVNLPQVVTIGECAFNEWKKGTKLTSLNLPNATTIGDWAFAYSSLLTSVNLPKVVTIGTVAFADCDLRTLDLPEATTIGGEAFMNNDNLVSCSAPKATTIDYYPWGSNGTSKLERLELTAVGDFTLGNNLFAYTPTEQIDLVLNKDKETQVTQNEDGTATWKTTNSNGGKLEYTFKSITFVGE